ncbi:MAG TPA: HD domain-containing phosphohydrolase [bacterium]|nr:HD domain-containing phosphohydrolase [bacterium]
MPNPDRPGAPRDTVQAPASVLPRATRAALFGDYVRHLPAAVGAATGLYAAVLLWSAQETGTAAVALVAGIAAGLALEHEPSFRVRAVGYLLGLLAVSLAVPATGLAVLAYGPWIVLAAGLFPVWTAQVGFGAAGVASYLLAALAARPPATPAGVLVPAAAIAVLHVGAALVAGEARATSHLALTDPLTGLANRRLLDWRLAEELSQAQRTDGTFALVYLDIQNFKDVNLRVGQRAGDRALIRIAQILRDTMRTHDVIARMGGDEFAILAPALTETDITVVVERIRTAVARATTLPYPLRVAAGWAIAPHDGGDAAALLETAESAVYEQKLQTHLSGPSLHMELTAALWNLPDGAQQLVRLLHAEGIELEEHLNRVGQWSLDLARVAELDPARQQTLAQAAVVHDVGKLVLPRSLLRKPGPLSPEEQGLLVKHVTSGVALLRAVAVDEAVIAIVAAHHERWDGGGYPNGLAGDRIPLEARILAIADGCDAMTARRPYRKAWTTDEAIADLQLEGGRQFDPELVNLIIPVLSAAG